MHCCGSITRSTGRVFSRTAGWYSLRYRWLGLDRDQQRMLDAVVQAGIDGASVLDIGCGVGVLHHRLLGRGADRAIGIDLSEGMLEEARRLAERQGLSERVTYLQGDFVDLAQDLDPADVTLLDRVVCCYPDAEALVNASLDKTRRVYALTYPRNHAVNRAGVTVMDSVLGLLGIEYRAYVHDPDRIEAWIAARGFQKFLDHHSPLWLAQVYVR
jgi:magnesium-protoporphyrin O-methyltransferase